MSDNQISRVNYFERQFLRTQDFTDEQAYHVAMRRRHNIAHHTWGIVNGLEVFIEEGNLFVQPGMAVDGYGRELILPVRQPLSTSAFLDRGSNELDVWLVYERTGSDQPPAGYAGCGAGAGGDLFYRWQETARVRLEKPDPDFPNRRAPESIAASDLNFPPSRTPPEDADWPVFLGQIIKDPTNPQQPFAFNPADRPYVGLVGESIVAPSGRTLVQIGAEREADPNRFAVFVADAIDPNDATPQPQLSIDLAGNLRVERDTSLHGNLTVAGGRIEFEAGAASAQTGAQPWSVYHVEDEETGTQELRVEMARVAEGGEPGNNSVVVGAWFKGADDKEEFQPCLTIDDNCTVTVHGNLVVLGQLTETKVRAQAGSTSEARNFIAGGFMSGIAGTSSLFPGHEAAAPGNNAMLGFKGGGADTGAGSTDALALALETDPEQFAAFSERIRTHHPELAEKLRAALSDIVTPEE